MRHFEDDFEIEAIEKCSRALSRLDDKIKIRVIKYLLDKFGLIAQADTSTKEVVNQNIQYQQNNLVLAEPKEIGKLSNELGHYFPDGTIINLKDVLIKSLAMTEPELLVVTGYYNSQFGKSTFTKQSILDSFRDNNIMSEGRRKNLIANLNSLIKKSYISSITDEEFSISPDGCEYAKAILSGNSQTKKRKPRVKRSKAIKPADQPETEVTEINDEA